MKYTFIVILLLHNFFCFSKHIEKITIEYANFNVLTFASVKCENFYSDFPEKNIKTIKFKDRKTISKFENNINKFTIIDKKNIDVRLKIFFVYANSTVSYCMDIFGRFKLEGQDKIYTNDGLYKLICQYIDVPNEYKNLKLSPVPK